MQTMASLSLLVSARTAAFRCASSISLCAALLAPAAVHAQSPDSLEVRQLIRRAWFGNWYVRAALDNDSAEGRVHLVSDTFATIGEFNVRYASVKLLERRIQQGGMGNAATLFGALGSGTMLLLLYGANGFPWLTYGGFLLGGAVGTIAGQLVAASHTVWTPVWPDSIVEAHGRQNDSIRAGQRADSLEHRSRGGMTTYFGVLYSFEDNNSGLPVLPGFGIQAQRSYGQWEVIPISVSGTVLIGFPALILIAQTGANFWTSEFVYLGASAGTFIIPEHTVPIGTVRVGLGHKDRAAFRFEAGVSVLGSGLLPLGVFNFGYTLPRR